MIRPSSFALAWLALPFLALGADAQSPAGKEIFVTVKAGKQRRSQTPIRFEMPEDRLPSQIRRALDAGPVNLVLGHANPKPTGVRGQFERVGDRPLVRGTFVLPIEIPEGGEARFALGTIGSNRSADQSLELSISNSPWSFARDQPGALDLKRGDRPVFRYNAGPVSSPNYKEIQIRDAYIHPAYSPSGALITGDFSPFHPHHRGFFLAYERTKSGDLTPDFWNIHVGTGKIHADGLEKPVAGPVTARFSARHRWEAKDKATGSGRVVLRERWDVEAYDIPGAPYWLFDVTSTQQAVDRPLELLPYRYGGMAYRGPEPFVKGTLDVLTSEGKHRRDGDQKPARWVDLTGPVADGSDRYAGAMIADHPTNPHFPNVARIHPTTLPFFSYVPAYDRSLTIATDAPAVFRYRILIHDGHPDPALDERVWRDFAEPPTVVVEPAPG